MELSSELSGSQCNDGNMELMWFSARQSEPGGEAHLYVFVDVPGVCSPPRWIDGKGLGVSLPTSSGSSALNSSVSEYDFF